MDDIERTAALKEVYLKFQKRPLVETVEIDVRQTLFMRLEDLQECCNFLKGNVEKLPFNVSKAIKDRYYANRPHSVSRKINCLICRDDGWETVEIFDPYFRWTMPCVCEAGKKHAWVNEKTDRPTTRYLQDRGVKFKDPVEPVEIKNYDNF